MGNVLAMATDVVVELAVEVHDEQVTELRPLAIW